MNVKDFITKLEKENVSFYCGVPDSLLKPMCHYLTDTYGISDNHIIAANEGNAVAIAAGYHLATGKIPCVYLQNSGLGNIVNPVTSLLNEKVYGIPCVFVVGWRGEPNISDEPQHVFQGEITLEQIETLGLPFFVIDKNVSAEKLEKMMDMYHEELQNGGSVCIVVKKGAFTYEGKINFENKNPMIREEILEEIINVSGEDIIVATTGKTSRELFEIREKKGLSHKYDFLTVGSMGHSSSIAFGVAISKKNTRVWCLDGDGSVLMHMGSMALIGQKSPENFIHVVINNGAHESVGGYPTVAEDMNFDQIAKAVGYREVFVCEEMESLINVLQKIESLKGPIFIEIKSAIGSREDLGRPTSSPIENKNAFMDYLRGLN